MPFMRHRLNLINSRNLLIIREQSTLVKVPSYASHQCAMLFLYFFVIFTILVNPSLAVTIEPPGFYQSCYFVAEVFLPFCWASSINIFAANCQCSTGKLSDVGNYQIWEIIRLGKLSDIGNYQIWSYYMVIIQEGDTPILEGSRELMYDLSPFWYFQILLNPYFMLSLILLGPLFCRKSSWSLSQLV